MEIFHFGDGKSRIIGLTDSRSLIHSYAFRKGLHFIYKIQHQNRCKEDGLTLPGSKIYE
jgi:hypothetical protein